MRRLVIRFLGVDEAMPPATRIFKNTIPDREFLELCTWATRGGKLWGRMRQRVAINVIKVTAPPEDIGHGAAEEVQGTTD